MGCGVNTELSQGLEGGPGRFDHVPPLVQERPAHAVGGEPTRPDPLGEPPAANPPERFELRGAVLPLAGKKAAPAGV